MQKMIRKYNHNHNILIIIYPMKTLLQNFISSRTYAPIPKGIIAHRLCLFKLDPDTISFSFKAPIVTKVAVKFRSKRY